MEMDDFLASLKENLAGVISGAFAVIVAFVAAWSKLAADSRVRKDARERQQKIDDDKARTAEMDGNAAQAQDLTTRFRMLMEGYENRIRDLTVSETNREAAFQSLRSLYEERLTVCSGCPHYATHAARKPDASAST